MPSPDPHYTLELINHETGDRLKIELIDLPFPGARSYDSHLPLLTLRASSMSHRFPRAPFASGLMGSGRGRPENLPKPGKASPLSARNARRTGRAESAPPPNGTPRFRR